MSAFGAANAIPASTTGTFVSDNEALARAA
jgi:hypothetical protein